jgi:two-component system, NarL family, nitrate/nitrite response regulator NarL
MTDVLRVVIADDHPPTRVGVREALEKQSCAVVAEAATAEEAVTAARELAPDVCLLDINMPGSGIAAAAEITHTMPDIAVVMLTASRDDEDLFAALRAGASGYLLKDMDPTRIGSALRGVLAGEAVLPRWLVLKVVDQLRATPRRRIALPNRKATAQLTEREAEILDLMANGLSTEDIAGRLFVAQVTVRSHIAAILRKLRVKDRNAAVRLAQGTGERPDLPSR